MKTSASGGGRLASAETAQVVYPAFEPDAEARKKRLPRWPVGFLIGGYPVWWLLGIADFSWILFAGVMALYLTARGNVRVPKGFLLWLLFLLAVLISSIRLTTIGEFSFYAYRTMQYLSATVLFLYIYNAWRETTVRYISGAATLLWLTTIVGGILGMLLPTTVYRSPLSFIVPQSVLSNDLVNRMVIRRFAQFEPDSWVQVEPRPSAPFLYTNNWGNAYALLLPLVLIYLIETRGERRRWWVMLSIPVSVVPAIATMNRGMFIGVGILIVYIAIRFLLLGRVLVAFCCAAALLVGVAAVVLSPALDQLEDRVENSGTNEDRSTVYVETLHDVAQSPILGMGGPRQNPNPKLPPVGSHGQFWIVVHSHGIPALAFFGGWFVSVYVMGARRRDFVGIASGGAILLALVQMTFYGFVPVGMALLMVSCAIALRAPDVPDVDRARE